MNVGLGFALDSFNINMDFFFDENDAEVRLVGSFTKVPENKLENAYEICNMCNARFRWVTFFVNLKNNSVLLKTDAIIQLDSCGEECETLMKLMTTVADEAYPMFMKEIWT